MDKDKIASKLKRSVLIGFEGINLLEAGKISARENNGDIDLSSSKFRTEVFQQNIRSEDNINKFQAMRRTYQYVAEYQVMFINN